METNQIPSKKDRKETFLSDYPPSWFDKFSRWLDSLPIPYWIIYVLFSVLVILIGVIIQISTYAGTISDWEPVYYVAIFHSGYVPFLIHYLNKQSALVLEEFKPALNRTGLENYEILKTNISTMPARGTMLMNIIFGLFGLSLFLWAILGPDSFGSSIGVGTGAFDLYIGLVMIMLWFTNGLLFYHTYHQMKLIN